MFACLTLLVSGYVAQYLSIYPDLSSYSVKTLWLCCSSVHRPWLSVVSLRMGSVGFGLIPHLTDCGMAGVQAALPTRVQVLLRLGNRMGQESVVCATQCSCFRMHPSPATKKNALWMQIYCSEPRLTSPVQLYLVYSGYTRQWWICIGV
jgi:hypothetical protein